MKELYLWTHLGMGDHINCNAIYRHFAKKNDLIHVFVKTRNAKNVKYMLRDLKNVDFIQGVGDQDEFVKQYLDIHRYIPLLKIGFDYLNKKTDKKFVDLFYEQIDLSPEERFKGFYLERDMEAEKRLCKILNPTGEPYIFVHHDTSRGHMMNFNYFKNKNIKVIESNYKFDDIKEYLLFHYLKLIEEAEEIHVMESSFSPLIDCYIKNKQNVYLHKYLRGIDSVGRKYWNIIN